MSENNFVRQTVKLGNSEINLYLREYELPHLAYLNPWAFLAQYYRGDPNLCFSTTDAKTYIKTYILNAMQEIFAKACYKVFQWGYCTAYLSNYLRNSFYRYLILRYAYIHDDWVTEFGQLCDELIGDPRNVSRTFLDEPDLRKCYELIISWYRDLDRSISLANFDREVAIVRVPKVFHYNEFADLGETYQTIRTLQQELRGLEEFIHVVLLHGSYATKDFVKGSDLDVAVFLDAKAFESVDTAEYVSTRLTKLCLLCYKVDILAHHRFSILTDLDLKYYPEYRTPRVLFNYGVSLIATKSDLKVQLRDDLYERTMTLWRGVQTLRQKLVHGYYPNDAFLWKNDVAYLLLIPTLTLQAIGIHTYKKFSFELAKEHFPSVDWSLVDEASAYRSQWVQTVNVLRYCPDHLLLKSPWKIGENLYKAARRIGYQASPMPTEQDAQAFIQQSAELTENLWFEILHRKGMVNA